MTALVSTKVVPQLIFKCCNCKAIISVEVNDRLSMQLQTLQPIEPFKLSVQCCSCLTMISVGNSQRLKSDFPYVLVAQDGGPIKVTSNSAPSLPERPMVQKKKNYYEVLNLTNDDQLKQSEIKKAYHKLALQHHPDKRINEDGGDDGETFKLICEAYAVLSDEGKRQQYDRYLKLGVDFEGVDSAAAQAMANPEQLLTSLFGGDRFYDIIGDIQVARSFGNAMEEQDSNLEVRKQKQQKRDMENAKIHKERVKKLSVNLIKQLSYYVEHHLQYTEGLQISLVQEKHLQRVIGEDFMGKCMKDIEELKYESYGVELLQAVGYLYSLKGEQYLGKEESFMGIGSMYANMKERGHFISSTFGTIRAAVSLQSTLKQLNVEEQAAVDANGMPVNQSKTLTQEQRQQLEEQASNKMIQIIWRAVKLEIQNVISDVAMEIFNPKTVQVPEGVDAATHVKEVLRRRARALAILGKAYQSAEKPTADITP